MSTVMPQVRRDPEPLRSWLKIWRSVANRASAVFKWLRRLAGIAVLARFSLLAFAIALYAIFFSDQFEDVLRTLAEDLEHSWMKLRATMLWLATVLCGAVIWYSARTMLRFRFEGQDASDSNVMPKFKKWAPRILGFAVPAAVAVRFMTMDRLESENSSILLAVLFLIGAAILGAALIERRSVAQRYHWEWFGQSETAEKRDLKSVSEAGSGVVRIVLALLALNVLCLLIFIWSPPSWSQAIGSLAIVMLGLALVTALGSVVTYWGNRYRVPALGLALLLAVLSSLTNDNHAVRRNALGEVKCVGAACAEAVPNPSSSGPVAAALSVPLYFAQWVAQLPAGVSPEEPVPVFIIAAEGGGIRAAYWTAAVLADLQDGISRLAREDSAFADVDFARHVFAISGVSGGSLGAATFVASVESQRTSPQAAVKQCALGLQGGSDTRAHVRCMLAQDFLAPTVAALLFPDFVQRFWPLPSFDDRARALERAWEAGWRNVSSASPERFSQPYTAFWTGDDPYRTPLLFFNSTVVETGQRALVHPLTGLKDARKDESDQFGPDALGGAGWRVSPRRPGFSDAVHVHDLLGADMPLSTAVLLSARFTYVSPAGSVVLCPRLHSDDEACDPSPRAPKRLRLVDGGYFDNSGAVTARELIALIVERIDSRAPSGADSGSRQILPIFLHLSNDPIKEDEVRRLPEADRPVASEVRSPLTTLLNTRSARGFQAREQLMDEVCRLRPPPLAMSPAAVSGSECRGTRPRGGWAFHFRLYDRGPDVPLGWTLSRSTIGRIDAELAYDTGTVSNNRPRLQSVTNLLLCYYGHSSCRRDESTASSQPSQRRFAAARASLRDIS